MASTGSEINRQYNKGEVKIALDLPKGEKLKKARAELSVGGNTLADFNLKSGKNRFHYYSRPGDVVSLTVTGQLRKARGVFAEKFDLKSGEDDATTRIKLSFVEPKKVSKPAVAKPATQASSETAAPATSASNAQQTV